MAILVLSLCTRWSKNYSASIILKVWYRRSHVSQHITTEIKLSAVSEIPCSPKQCVHMRTDNNLYEYSNQLTTIKALLCLPVYQWGGRYPLRCLSSALVGWKYCVAYIRYRETCCTNSLFISPSRHDNIWPYVFKIQPSNGYDGN